MITVFCSACWHRVHAESPIEGPWQAPCPSCPTCGRLSDTPVTAANPTVEHRGDPDWLPLGIDPVGTSSAPPACH
jgi:hypothetical protein